ncbi:MAG: hypoxanthine-guanine phosphoribosyltransferase [marine bacterium B5-7]|nr:MAG: hypoxanthine-guanine phosphoribosyltransferase [marine bacterium B5-7]
MTKESITTEDAQAVLNDAEQLFSAKDVDQAIANIAIAVTEKLSADNPVVLPVMNGGLILGGKLIPQLDFPLQVDYIHATRYRGATNGSELHWLKRAEIPLQDRTVLLIDDILDQGITLAAIIEDCYTRGAKKVLTAVLAKKIIEQEKPIKNADFTGLKLPDRYVFGSGMDYHEYHRNLTGIYAI